MTTAPLSNLTATWNAGGTTFSAIKMNVTDTASAAGSLLMDLQVGGVSRFSVQKTAGAFFTTNLCEVRNGTNAQTFGVYNTFTDASNYERALLVWESNIVSFIQNSAGSGSARQFKIGTAGNSAFTVRTNGADRWSFMPTGHILAEADNVYDIGASGSNRPRNMFVAGYLSIGDGIAAPIAVAGQARIYVDTVDGDLKVIFGDGTIKTIVTDT